LATPADAARPGGRRSATGAPGWTCPRAARPRPAPTPASTGRPLTRRWPRRRAAWREEVTFAERVTAEHDRGFAGQVSDVVDGVLFLEYSPYTTGEILHVDGGQIVGR
jgi:NAD(P)-dependent dehydrogenase (short-subunit alcohol dehydrogenase family)